MKIQQNYNVVFKIGEYNFSDTITKIEIGSSLNVNTIYPIFFIHFKIDSKLLFISEFYKKEEIKLQISLTDVDKKVKEINNFDLIGIAMNFKIGMKGGTKSSQLLPDHPLSQPVLLVAISRSSFIAMTTTVNKLFTYTKRYNPLECVSELCTQFINSLEKQINYSNKNNNTIEQMLIPPMTFASAVRFINSKYPLYNGGIPFLFCNTDDILQIWDLTQKIKEKEHYKIFYLSKGETDKATINRTPGPDYDYYFTSVPEISTNFQANKSIIKYGYDNIFVEKPLTNLYNYSNINMGEIYETHGVKDNNPENISPFAKNLQYRKSVKYNLPGSEDDDTLNKSTLSKNIRKIVEIKISIIGNTPIKKLIQIGVPMFLHSNIIEQAKFNGKYIVDSSYIVFTKIDSSNYRFGNMLTGFRGNF